MPQVEYKDTMKQAFPGQSYSSAHSGDVITAINDDPRAAQVVEFTVGSAATSGDLTINSVTISASGETDEQDVAAALSAGINADPLLSGTVEAEVSTDTVTVTALIGGLGYTYEAGSNVTASETQANAEAATVKPGRVLTITGETTDGCLLVKTVSGSGDAVVGICQYSAANYDKDVSGYEGGSAINVATSGRLYVPVEESVSVGDDVYYRHTADGSLDVIGGFAASSGTGLAQLSSGAKWIHGSQDGVAVLQFDFV